MLARPRISTITTATMTRMASMLKTVAIACPVD
jgi:hypothetical protein